MTIHADFDWRSRAIALASLGAASLTRVAFSPADASDPQPLEMQILVALALQDSLAADPPHRAGADWLSIALRLVPADVEVLVHRLESANLVRRAGSAQDALEIQYELAEDYDEDLVAGELSISLTALEFDTVDRWLSHTRRLFDSWPPERPDADDAVA